MLIREKDTEDLAEKMEYMIENKDKIENMAKYSHEYAKKRFNVDIINKKMIEIMQI